MEVRKKNFSTQFHANQTSEWKEKYCDFDSIFTKLTQLKASRKESSSLNQPINNITEDSVALLIQQEIDKVAEFYNFKLEEYQDRFKKLSLMGACVCNIPSFHDHLSENSDPVVMAQLTQTSANLSLKEMKHQHNILKEAVTQLYRASMMLYNFALLNNTAFVKLFDEFHALAVKDHDLFAILHDREFSKAKGTQKLRDSLELMYSSAFTGKLDTTKARSELTERRHDKRDINMYLIGFFFGISLPFLVLWFLSGILTYYVIDITSDTFLALLPVFRLVWIPTLGLYMYGLDTLVWHRARINYQFIFEYNPKTALGYRSVFLWSAIFLAIFSCFLFLGYNYVVDLFTIPHISQDVGLILWPIAMLFLISIIVLYPFNFFWRSSRLCFLLTSLQVFIAPFGTVGFREFFVGDVYTSLVKTMFDLEYTICFYVTGDFLTESDSTCDGVNNFMLPFISVAPLYWRFAQCLKRFYITREKVHIANALKYGCASLVVLFSTLEGNFQQYEPGYWPITRILWLISFILSTLYTYTWDVFMDWGLGRPKSKYFLLRDKLVWQEHRWFYYYCIISNFFFRFFWAITITPFTVIVDMQPEMLNLIAASIEIIRRFTWAILRVENEHLNNCGKFRAVNFIPLPFDVNKTHENEVGLDGSLPHHLEEPEIIPGDKMERNTSGIPIITGEIDLEHAPITSPKIYYPKVRIAPPNPDHAIN